ncbi:MAG TPA: NADAR family protein [Ktedonobacterales bacterium]|jgi:hypothetical protein
MAITFYGTLGQYGAFSNFARYAFSVDGVRWQTSEHYFQAHKFAKTDPAHFEAIHRALTPKIAATLGRDRAHSLRADWERVKDDVMREALRHKFAAHAELRALLLATGDESIIESAPHDAYWGWGADQQGKNMLGVLLMELRAALRQAS